MPRTITTIEAHDVRFPTSRSLDGSDAMNPDPDYSLAYAIVHTDADDGLEGHGFTFTIGRGTDICVAAVEALAPRLRGWTLERFVEGPGEFWRHLTGDSQLRWLGPEKGVIHLATAALVNAMWDLWAKAEGKPLWKLLADLEPERIVDCVEFLHITDALTREEALDLLRRAQPGQAEREDEMRRTGFPAYTTSAAWLGYSDEKLRALCREALDQGWTHFKMKVGADLDEDVRRAALLRGEIGSDCTLAVDANQVWGVEESIEKMRRLAEFDPLWIEEPTSPDDVLGHARIARGVAPIGVATGEHCANRVMFKQLFQADAIAYCQVDACRLGGVNEVLAVLLMAAKFGVPVCPHSGGVGLSELTQHISIFNYVRVSPSLEGTLLEYADHLHEHFLDPVRMRQGHYLAPEMPGYSAELRPASLREFEFPTGAAWATEAHAEVSA